jgi:hypothetical protein
LHERWKTLSDLSLDGSSRSREQCAVARLLFHSCSQAACEQGRSLFLPYLLLPDCCSAGQGRWNCASWLDCAPVALALLFVARADQFWCLL